MVLINNTPETSVIILLSVHIMLSITLWACKLTDAPAEPVKKEPEPDSQSLPNPARVVSAQVQGYSHRTTSFLERFECWLKRWRSIVVQLGYYSTKQASNFSTSSRRSHSPCRHASAQFAVYVPTMLSCLHCTVTYPLYFANAVSLMWFNLPFSMFTRI